MNLKILSNSALISQLKHLVDQERSLLTDILQHLLEVENRKLHLEEGYGSLFSYAVEVLHYSEAQAYRRIAAMRLLREIPEVSESIRDGSLNLTHLTQAREYFRDQEKKAEPLSKNEKVDLLNSIENKSKRETEKVFAKLDPTPKTPDQERTLDENLIEIRFTANRALLDKLKHFKALDSHVQNNPSYAELFERMVDIAIQQKEKAFHTKTRDTRPRAKNEPSSERQKFSPAKKPSRYIPVFIRKVVSLRDGRACTYKNPCTGKTCGSTYKLQYDHIRAFAKKGESTLGNLRILCQAHNLLLAEKIFGIKKMKTHWKILH